MRVLAALLVLLLSGCTQTLVPVEVTRIVEVVVTATPESTGTPVPLGDGWHEVGPLRVKLLHVQDTGSTIILGKNDFEETTEGKFIRVILRAENTGKEPLNLGWDMDMALIDSQDRMFTEFHYTYSYNDLCQYTRLNPGLGAECFAVFDVAPDAEGLRFAFAVNDDRVQVPITPVPLALVP